MWSCKPGMQQTWAVSFVCRWYSCSATSDANRGSNGDDPLCLSDNGNDCVQHAWTRKTHHGVSAKCAKVRSWQRHASLALRSPRCPRSNHPVLMRHTNARSYHQFWFSIDDVNWFDPSLKPICPSTRKGGQDSLTHRSMSAGASKLNRQLKSSIPIKARGNCIYQHARLSADQSTMVQPYILHPYHHT